MIKWEVTAADRQCVNAPSIFYKGRAFMIAVLEMQVVSVCVKLLAQMMERFLQLESCMKKAS
jgi:hypothetical protein